MSVARPLLIRKLFPKPSRRSRYAYRFHNAWLRFAVPLTYNRRNRSARQALLENQPRLTEPGRRVLDRLRDQGLAHAHFSELVPSEAWKALESAVGEWLRSPEHLRRVETARQAAGKLVGGKTYQITRSEPYAPLPFADPLLRFGVRGEILDIVNLYMGLMSKMIGANGWHTIPVSPSMVPRESQKWHRDPEDTRLVKVFAYLTDADVGNGATEYVLRSRPGDRYGHLFPRTLPHGFYPPPGGIEDRIPDCDRVTCAFPAGTIVFLDTSGFHRGGRATRGDRVLVNWIYTSQATWYERWFRVGDAPGPKTVPVAERFALLGAD